MLEWDLLSMKLRAAFIRNAVARGIYNVEDIVLDYNEFRKGGPIETPIYEDLPKMLRKAGLDIKVTSGYRPAGTVGNAGLRSWHHRHGAVDIVPQGNTTFEDIENVLHNNPAIRQYMLSHNFGLIDESGRTPESKLTMKKTGATGAHFHIGKDSKYAALYRQRVGAALPEGDRGKTVYFTNPFLPLEQPAQLALIQRTVTPEEILQNVTIPEPIKPDDDILATAELPEVEVIGHQPQVDPLTILSLIQESAPTPLVLEPYLIPLILNKVNEIATLRNSFLQKDLEDRLLAEERRRRLGYSYRDDSIGDDIKLMLFLKNVSANGGNLFEMGGLGVFNDASINPIPEDMIEDFAALASPTLQPKLENLKKEGYGFNVEDYAYRVKKFHPNVTEEQVKNAYINTPVIASDRNRGRVQGVYNYGDENGYGRRIMMYPSTVKEFQGVDESGLYSKDAQLGHIYTHENSHNLHDQVKKELTPEEAAILKAAYGDIFNTDGLSEQEALLEMEAENTKNREILSKAYNNATKDKLTNVINKDASDKEIINNWLNSSGYTQDDNQGTFKKILFGPDGKPNTEKVKLMRNAMNFVAFNPYEDEINPNYAAFGGPLNIILDTNSYGGGGGLMPGINIPAVAKTLYNKAKNRLYRTITPQGYHLGRAAKEFIKGDTRDFSKFTPAENEVWARYLGVPYEGESSFEKAIYTPTKGGATYDDVIKFKDESQILSDDVLRQLLQNQMLTGKNTMLVKGNESGLGTYTLSLGEDENGKYISYYDDWDINPTRGLSAKYKIPLIELIGDIVPGSNPFTVYGRRYYTDEDLRRVIER